MSEEIGPTFDEEMSVISMTIEQAKEKIALADALERLQNNQYFKLLITDKYLDKYASNLVKLKQAMGHQSPEAQKHIDAQMIGIGQLFQFFGYVRQEGLMSEKALADNELARAEMLEEQKGV